MSRPAAVDCQWQSAPPEWGCSWHRPGRGWTCHWCWRQAQQRRLCSTERSAGTARGPAGLWPAAAPAPPWDGKQVLCLCFFFIASQKHDKKTRTCCVTEYLSASTLDWISLLILTSSPGPDSAFCGSVVKPVTHPERGNDRTAKQKEVVHIGLPIAETNNSKQVVRKELYPTCVSGSQDLIIRLFPHTATLDGRHTLRQHLVRKIQGHLASVIWWKEINRHSYLRKVR